AARARVPSNLPKFAGKRGAMEKPTSGWFLHWSSTTRSEEHTWGIFREHVLQHFEASNYQAVLREKLQRLKQTADIESYNGEYSALIFRVEGMSVLDQILCYTNGFKPRTTSYVRVENPKTLSDVVDFAVKYEVDHFADASHVGQIRHEKNDSSDDRGRNEHKSFKGKPIREIGRFKTKSENKRTEDRTCSFCKKPGHLKANYFA
ncbi:hypothetical protein PHMEG_00039791, partial [Phytophthora megakarya]